MSVPPVSPRALRSRAWFDNPDNIDMTALYLERYLNFGLTLEELQSGRPIIGIAQTGSDLSPCNRHHLVLAERVREGIRSAGGIVLEFPVHPIQETGKRPTAGLDRNLSYLGLVELLYGYPLASAPARAPLFGRPASCWRPARSTMPASSSWWPARPPRPATATPWARPRP
jgi:dihydroxy-acid dehydratase